jgi:hypothetical protein
MNLTRRIHRVAAILGLLVVSRASAEIYIDAGTHDLLPETPGQRIQIFVTGGDPVMGVSLRVQVATGFPHVPGSADVGPRLTEATLIADSSSSIFAGTGAEIDPGSGPQLAFRYLTVSTDPVPAEGLLAELVLDTTGTSEGAYPLRLNEVFGGAPTTLYDMSGRPIPTTINEGQLVVRAPETFERWRARHDGSGGVLLIDPLADADADGLSNLAEYAFATQPLEVTSTSRGGPRASSSGDQLLIEYRRPRLAGDLVYTVEVTSDLLHWRPAGAWTDYDEAREALSDTVERVSLRFTAGDPAIRFVRIRAEIHSDRQR